MLYLPSHPIEEKFKDYSNLFEMKTVQRSNYLFVYTSCNSLSDSFFSTYSNIAW